MPTNRRILSQDAAVSAGDADAAQGLVLHLDANDEDSIESGGANTGAGSGTWFDIANHDLNVPLADKSSNLILNLDGGIYSSGAWQDQTTNGNNAALNGNAAYNSDVRGYFTLDGTGDYLQISDNSSLNLAGGGATYEIWFRQHVLAGSEHLFGRFEGVGHRDLFISTGSSGAISLHFYDGTSSVGNIDSGGSKYTANTWHHIAVTLSSGSTGGTIKLYIDGTLEGSTTLSGNRVADATADLFLGRLGSGNAFELDGDIGTTRIYNVALTASEVAQNFRAGNFLSYDSTYDTGLALHFDAADIDTSANTWTDKVASLVLTKSGSSSYDKELGDYLELEGGYYVNDSAAVQVKDTEGDFTVEYFSQQVFDASNAILGIMQNATQRGLFIGETTSYLLIYNYNGGATTSQGLEVLNPTNYITANKWHHNVIVFDRSASIKLYVDGLEVASTTNIGSTPWTTTDGIRIGDAETLSYGSNGRLGFLKIYQGKLSDAQVAQNYLATKNDYPNGYNGTISGADFDTNSSSPNEKYFDFSGATSDLITIPDNDLFDMNANSSMEVWLTKSSGTAHIINKKDGASQENWAFWATASAFYFYPYNTSNVAPNIVTTSTLNATWNHVTITVGSSLDFELYLNGSSEATGTVSGTMRTDTATVKIGSYNGSHAYAGKVAMLKFHAKELSSSEVTANYNATKATFGIS